MMLRPAHACGWIGAAAVVAVVAALHCGCVAPSRPGQLRHHNWWNYYERGLHLLREGDVGGARQDFERALGVRAGARFGFEKDTWRARTYGMHFVEVYFPNRELGVCLLRQDRPAEAVRYLETSMKHAPSGRAKHYLNEARRRLLERGAAAPPVIEFKPATMARWTRERARQVGGTARGEARVCELTVGGEREFVELAVQSLAFGRNVRLAEGTNEIEVVATDLLGRQARKRIAWIADWSPPVLVLRAARGKGEEQALIGACYDNLGLGAVSMDGVEVFRPAPGERCCRKEVSFPLASGRTAVVKVEDMAGNRVQIPVSGAELAMLDEREQMVEVAAWQARGTLADCAVLPIAAAAGTDRMRPSLRLSTGRALIEVFREEFFLDGEASDGGGLASVTVNGEEQLREAGAEAKRAYFARRVELAEGTNRFEIVAADVAGNANRKVLTVVRRCPEHLDSAHRLTVGVPPLRTPSEDGMGDIVKRVLEDELLREPVRFHLLERDEGWEYILREQQLSLSDLADRKAALKIGKMLPAEMLMMGALTPHEKGVTVRLEVIETASARPLVAEDVYCEDLFRDMEYQLAGLTMKVERHFPLVSGRVVECSSGNAAIDVGYEQGVRAGTRFVVVRPRKTDASLESGSVCRTGEDVIELDVMTVSRTTGRARILPRDGAEAVKAGDRIYAR